jgi:D-amino-acid dehydrogenase
MHVCVIGGGIIGQTSAYFLRQHGHQVTVVEREAGPGLGASAANGAQLSYSYVQPLADPSVLASIPKLLLARDSPLKWTPQLHPAQWRWCMAFLAACRTSMAEQTTVQLLQLAEESRAAFERFRQQEQLDCDFAASGKLVLYPDAQGLEGAKRQVAFQAQHGGSQQRVVTVEQAVSIEPALRGYAGSFHGAVYTESECAIDGLKLCQALDRRLSADGVKLLYRHSADGFVSEGGQIRALHVTDANGQAQHLEADQFVVAAGALSAPLLATLGLKPAVYPLKGYSITVPVSAVHAAPRVSITDLRRKTVFARLGERLRVAGMVEICGYDRSISTRRIAELHSAAVDLFGQGIAPDDNHAWMGWRPATPTGRPIIGAYGFNNLLLNSGQGALGMTLAFGSGERLAQLLA